MKRGDEAFFELRSRDVYGRLVGRLFVNGKDLGAQLVQQGSVMAWDGFVGRCDDLNYSELEMMAKDVRVLVYGRQSHHLSAHGM